LVGLELFLVVIDKPEAALHNIQKLKCIFIHMRLFHPVADVAAFYWQSNIINCDRLVDTSMSNLVIFTKAFTRKKSSIFGT